MDLKGFSKRCVELAEMVGENSDAIVRKVVLSVDSTVVSATPVDTGRARSNWVVELNGPYSSTQSAYAPGSGGSSASQNTKAALDQAKAIAEAYNGNTHTGVHITNNLDYIKRLNEGYSAQAPSGFVETAILNGLKQIKDTKLLVRFSSNEKFRSVG